MKRPLLVLALLIVPHANALDAGPDDVYVRVVDVGPGLCTVTKAPRGHYMVYDAGHWHGEKCIEAVRQIVEGEEIDLLIISHSDSDHLADADTILREYRVRQIIQTGDPRWGTPTWEDTNALIAEEAKFSATVINLQTVKLVPGTQISLGEATVTLVFGLDKWVGAGPTESERKNAISIVARLDYRGGSILFTGDTVGRRKDDLDDACKDAEKLMVDNHEAGIVSLKADALTAPHHGGNNGSSRCFIEAVDPAFVIFSAGHQHKHPTKAAAERYIAHGVSVDAMFRTDRGDDESGPLEWKQGSIPGCSDGRGDDDVEIVIRSDGTVEVDYRQPQVGC